MKLCLLRGLIVAVKIAFMSEDIDAKNLTHGPPRPVHDSSSSFECLLCEWNVWLRLRYIWSYKAGGIKYNYDPDGIIFSVGLCHVRVSASLCGRRRLSFPSKSVDVLLQTCRTNVLFCGCMWETGRHFRHFKMCPSWHWLRKTQV
jgi:hypothetical protein